jgi:hypothetical protein
MSDQERREKLAEMADLVYRQPSTPENYARFLTLLEGFGDMEQIGIMLGVLYDDEIVAARRRPLAEGPEMVMLPTITLGG